MSSDSSVGKASLRIGKVVGLNPIKVCASRLLKIYVQMYDQLIAKGKHNLTLNYFEIVVLQKN